MKKTNRIEKTIKAINELYGCKHAKVTHIYKDKRDNVFVCFVTKRKFNQFAGKRLTSNETITMNERYVWGVRCGYFCDPREERKHYNNNENYELVYKA